MPALGSLMPAGSLNPALQQNDENRAGKQ